ncbi:alanine--tRNA ligase/alanyl-tRNA synthetase [Caldisphaera lagunensis DSM 15908]|uniref:Alanine--tRNA ligase n=1 Tax=Caldisphaera lagunensis (strain DSM 15908 / JCM 11604 / ANMR 0165 / IC-154) TaxID=1056495 RepID=L0AD87_CALLD|nr:alanine--tRNA ligase [Caldisphaera lagunensis]AFZ71015.1 alanine--tRNA ligase/alanyl-tRNA synthetase [Caldisphaera lagunensis DSM 15908]
MVRLNPEDYRLEFFKENGFQRKKCKIGKEDFWTLNQEFDTCQDAPDTEYWFDKISSINGLSVREAREKFIKFFEKNGHTPIKPRPVVARWREDLYLTIASIVDFQPHVTSGLVPPPANPLVVSQPSIRLEDIDNVGLTIGRHLTTFEMAAHHAFNYPDKKIYWKDETVRYAYEFFTKELKIPGDLLVFKESWWEGGGNAGPCFEVTVGGLELATLVFMMYKVDNGNYIELPLKIVDTGYGVERMAWFTQKTPTAFKAIFGNILDEYRKILDVKEPPEKILWEAFRAAGRLEPENPESVKEFYERISKNTGFTFDEVKNYMELDARLYSLLDHSRTISLMLGDGIVPSNTGEGYLARLVIRRALKQLMFIKENVSLADLVDLQIKLWGVDFPQLIDNKSYIIDVIIDEEKKFKETLNRGIKLTSKSLKSGTISLDDLIKFYDSYGIPPEIIASEAKKRNVNVEIPINFYSIIASRHKAPSTVRKIEEKSRLPEEIVSWAKTFKQTNLLFHQNPYAKSFTAKILGTKGKYLILDSTLFYPTGGGQINDMGKVSICDKEYKVVNVEKVDNVVVHEVDKEIEDNCEDVYGEIDWERRYRLMRHHTGTHLLMGALRKVLGDHVWQAGAEKTPEKGRLDVTHYKLPSKEEIKEIERLANKVIDERRPINHLYMNRTDAENKYGFRLYQGGVPMTPTIRIIDIENWDSEACFGTHLTNTGEIGGFKITNVEKIQDGIVRFEFVAGTRVPEEMEKEENKIEELGKILGSKQGEELQRAKALMEENEELNNKIKSYRKIWEEEVENSINNAPIVKNVRITFIKLLENDISYARELLKKLTSKYDDLLIGVIIENDNKTQIEIASGKNVKVELGKLSKIISNKFNGSGGGKGSYASLIINEKINGEELLNTIKDLL